MAAKRKQIAKPSVLQTQAPKPPTATTIKPTSKFAKPKLISSKLSYKGKVFSVFTDKLEEPGGFVNTRDVIRHNGSVVILLIRQYRHAAGQFLIELPAGRVDAGEATLAAAKREMIEETGYRAKRWTMMLRYFASPGF